MTYELKLVPLGTVIWIIATDETLVLGNNETFKVAVENTMEGVQSTETEPRVWAKEKVREKKNIPLIRGEKTSINRKNILGKD